MVEVALPGPQGDDPTDATRALLARLGAPERLAGPLSDTLGPGAAGELAADPWLLLRLPEVTVSQADHCARRLLGDTASPADPRRGRALIARLLRQAAREGHTALAYPRLSGALRGCGVTEPEAAVAAALEASEATEVVIEPEEDAAPEEAPQEPAAPDRFLALPRLADAERRLGEGIVRLLAGSEPIMDTLTATETIDAEAHRRDPSPAVETSAAVVTAALRGVCVLRHGAAGRQALYDVVALAGAIARESRTRLVVACPTRRTAAAFGAWLADTGVAVTSLARLLETGSERPVDADWVIVPEAMALGVRSAAALVGGCGSDTHLTLLADTAQAPSAAPGRVVADVLDSGTVAAAPLPRDPHPSRIAALAGTVAEGELGRVDATDRDIAIVPAASAREAAHRALRLLSDSVPRVTGLSIGEIQLLTPRYGGEAGAADLNAAAKARINPGTGHYGGFDIGDRVVLAGEGEPLGEVGHVDDADGHGLTVRLADGTSVRRSPDGLRHGWALTIAAAHGATWPAAVVVFPPESPSSRPQVYTALTRACEHLSVVHAAGPDLARAVRDVATITRHTTLADILRYG